MNCLPHGLTGIIFHPVGTSRTRFTRWGAEREGNFRRRGETQIKVGREWKIFTTYKIYGEVFGRVKVSPVNPQLAAVPIAVTAESRVRAASRRAGKAIFPWWKFFGKKTPYSVDLPPPLLPLCRGLPPSRFFLPRAPWNFISTPGTARRPRCVTSGKTFLECGIQTGKFSALTHFPGWRKNGRLACVASRRNL